MNKNSKQVTRKYFAAANSYKGFVSLFDSIFQSQKFNKIYVLKGGPGTGKSSFMKKVSAELINKKCDVDEIYCSSDPYSLDGIIAKEENKIAIIDGTAPHERDAVIPGAIDEIINLGCGWDENWLIAKRDKITGIVKEKKKAYETAYSYLKIAGIADQHIRYEYNNVFDKNKAKIKAEEILSSIPPSQSNDDFTFFISSFGRYGKYKIKSDEVALGRIIHVGGNDYASDLFLDYLGKIAISKDLSPIIIKSPLTPAYPEGIYFENVGITILKSAITDIHSSAFLSDDKIYSERTRKALELYKEALEESQRWFSIASELHFQLEEIYGAAMDFSKIDNIFVQKLIEIENILKI